MVASASQFLGIGMYSPAEAAMYVRVTARTMSRWVHGDGSGAAAIRAEVPDAPDKTITFLDLVQAMAIRAIREAGVVPLQKIRQAIEMAAEKGVMYPFARKHTTYLLGTDVHLQLPDETFLQASGRGRGQYGMRKVYENYLDDLTFSPSGIATSYVAGEFHGKKIVMNPEFRFGEPILEGSGYTALTLWQACVSEGSAEAAAEAYGVDVTEVRSAFKYIDSIRPATRAA